MRLADTQRDRFVGARGFLELWQVETKCTDKAGAASSYHKTALLDCYGYFSIVVAPDVCLDRFHFGGHIKIFLTEYVGYSLHAI